MASKRARCRDAQAGVLSRTPSGGGELGNCRFRQVCGLKRDIFPWFSLLLGPIPGRESSFRSCTGAWSSSPAGTNKKLFARATRQALLRLRQSHYFVRSLGDDEKMMFFVAFLHRFAFRNRFRQGLSPWRGRNRRVDTFAGRGIENKDVYLLDVLYTHLKIHRVSHERSKYDMYMGIDMSYVLYGKASRPQRHAELLDGRHHQRVESILS